MKKPNAMRIQRNAGFSLIELMIGVALGLIVLAALTSFFVSTSANRHEIERTSRQIENGRFAIDTLRSELHLAGFYAELQQGGATWQMPNPCATDLASMGFVLGPPLLIPLPISGYAMDAAMPGCLTDKVPNTDVVVIRRFNTEVTPPAAPVAAQYYFQPSRCQSDSTTLPWVFNAGSSGAFTLRRVDCGGQASLYRFRVSIFYLRTWSVTVGDKVPTLVKLELDNGAINVYPMVEGIQDMRFEYGIDTNDDGGPDEYRRCDTSAPLHARPVVAGDSRSRARARREPRADPRLQGRQGIRHGLRASRTRSARSATRTSATSTRRWSRCPTARGPRNDDENPVQPARRDALRGARAARHGDAPRGVVLPREQHQPQGDRQHAGQGRGAGRRPGRHRAGDQPRGVRRGPAARRLDPDPRGSLRARTRTNTRSR
jgi:type IV pilus assembly protein PilW